MGVSMNEGPYSMICHDLIDLTWSDIHNFHRSLLFVMRALLSLLSSRINRLRWRQRSLVARLLWEQDVGSSNLSTPTTFFFGPLIGSCDSSGSYQFVARRP